MVSVVTHAGEEGGNGVTVGGCLDECCAVGGGEAFLGAPARVLPGAVESVEGVRTGGVGRPWVVHLAKLAVPWHRENFVMLFGWVCLWRKERRFVCVIGRKVEPL